MRPCDVYVWSPETFPHLDESQILAIRMALSREFVLIQGPPGTGKTFIGLQIVEILLRNQSQWWEDQKPFLVVCYTNHALDQFMEGILRFQPTGVVRIGGRSRSDKVAACSLRTLCQAQLPALLGAAAKHQYGWMRKALQQQQESIAYRTAVLELLRRGILTDAELDAEIRADNLERSWRAGRFDMRDWLKIYPEGPEETPPSAQSRGRKAGAEDKPWPCHRDERALDDEDGLDSSEWRRSTMEEKFAYILPAEGSSSHQVMQKCLEEGDIMTDEDVANVRDVGELRLRDRWRLYRSPAPSPSPPNHGIVLPGPLGEDGDTLRPLPPET